MGDSNPASRHTPAAAAADPPLSSGTGHPAAAALDNDFVDASLSAHTFDAAFPEPETARPAKASCTAGASWKERMHAAAVSLFVPFKVYQEFKHQEHSSLPLPIQPPSPPPVPVVSCHHSHTANGFLASAKGTGGAPPNKAEGVGNHNSATTRCETHPQSSASPSWQDVGEDGGSMGCAELSLQSVSIAGQRNDEAGNGELSPPSPEESKGPGNANANADNPAAACGKLHQAQPFLRCHRDGSENSSSASRFRTARKKSVVKHKLSAAFVADSTNPFATPSEHGRSPATSWMSSQSFLLSSNKRRRGSRVTTGISTVASSAGTFFEHPNPSTDVHHGEAANRFMLPSVLPTPHETSTVFQQRVTTGFGLLRPALPTPCHRRADEDCSSLKQSTGGSTADLLGCPSNRKGERGAPRKAPSHPRRHGDASAGTAGAGSRRSFLRTVVSQNNGECNSDDDNSNKLYLSELLSTAAPRQQPFAMAIFSSLSSVPAFAEAKRNAVDDNLTEAAPLRPCDEKAGDLTPLPTSLTPEDPQPKRADLFYSVAAGPEALRFSGGLVPFRVGADPGPPVNHSGAVSLKGPVPPAEVALPVPVSDDSPHLSTLSLSSFSCPSLISPNSFDPPHFKGSSGNVNCGKPYGGGGGGPAFWHPALPPSSQRSRPPAAARVNDSLSFSNTPSARPNSASASSLLSAGLLNRGRRQRKSDHKVVASAHHRSSRLPFPTSQKRGALCLFTPRIRTQSRSTKDDNFAASTSALFTMKKYQSVSLGAVNSLGGAVGAADDNFNGTASLRTGFGDALIELMPAALSATVFTTEGHLVVQPSSTHRRPFTKKKKSVSSYSVASNSQHQGNNTCRRHCHAMKVFNGNSTTLVSISASLRVQLSANGREEAFQALCSQSQLRQSRSLMMVMDECGSTGDPANSNACAETVRSRSFLGTPPCYWSSNDRVAEELEEEEEERRFAEYYMNQMRNVAESERVAVASLAVSVSEAGRTVGRSPASGSIVRIARIMEPTTAAASEHNSSARLNPHGRASSTPLSLPLFGVSSDRAGNSANGTPI